MKVWRFDSGLVRRFLLPAAIAVLTVSCGNEKEVALSAGTVVLALGDSLTAGAGVAPEQAWPALLAQRTGWEIINGGVNGNTSADALRRLPMLLEEHEPALVLVTVGGNDMLHRLPREETIANIGQVIALIEERGAKPVLLATPQPSIAGAAFQSLSAPDFYRKLADERHVHLIEDAIPEVLSDPQLKGDPLHPNAAGHALLAEKIEAGLREIGYAR